MKKTVVSVGLSRDNNNNVTLRVEDAHSGDKVLDIDFTLEEVGVLLTRLHGVLHGVKGIAHYNEDGNIATKRVIKEVSCDKVRYSTSSGKDAQISVVNNDFIVNWEPLGWILHSDGCSSQQHDKYHNYTIERYEPVEDVLNVEKFY